MKFYKHTIVGLKKDQSFSQIKIMTSPKLLQVFQIQAVKLKLDTWLDIFNRKLTNDGSFIHLQRNLSFVIAAV